MASQADTATKRSIRRGRLQHMQAPMPMGPLSVAWRPPKMITLIVALSSVVLPLIHLGLSSIPRSRGRVVHLLLLYALVLDVGVIGLPFGFIPHIFFPD